MSDSSNEFEVSIVIPTINKIDLVKQCVKSLKNNTEGINYEIIVVDDGSKQKTQNSLQNLADQLDFKLILKENNTGFSATVNRGIKVANGKYIVLTNNDITFTQNDWLQQIIETANLDPRIGIVGCRLLYPNGKIQHSGVSFNKELGACTHDHRHKQANHPPALKIKKVLFVTGALMLIKRKTIADIGLFDENFFAGNEDIEYCLRAREKKWMIMYCGKAKATHLEGATRGALHREDIKDFFKKGVAKGKQLWNKVTMPPTNEVNEKKSNPDIPQNKARIIYVLPKLNLAGGVKIVLEHANRLAQKGFYVMIFSLQDNIDWFNLKVPIKCYENYESLTKALKKFDCLKIATWWKTAQVVFNSCNPQKGGKGVPAYFVQDMEDKFYPKQPEIQKKVKSTYELPMIYFTGSKWVKEQLEENYNQSVTNISHAINLDIFKPQKKVINYDCRQIMAYSKPGHLKKFFVTKTAIQQIVQKIKFISLVTFCPQAQCEVNYLPHTHYSQLTEQQLAYLYNSSGVFVHHSKHEDFGLPILEAMACGTPVVTTKANGNLEYCQDGYNCLLAPPDNVPELTKKIKQILTNPDLANRLAQNGIKTAQKYNWQRTIDNLDSLISQTLQADKIIKKSIKKEQD